MDLVGNRIFLRGGDDELVPMEESEYDSEKELQQLLSDFPNLLGGDQMGDGTSSWLWVDSELGVPDEEELSSRWAVDHLFLDRNGVPTLVEVKRSSDRRIRREVVGQMLDYAANTTRFFEGEDLRDVAAERPKFEDDFEEFLDEDSSAQEFWEDVDKNLHSGNIRILFVADKIPPELKSIVEFLNEQMSETEVLALEVKQFVGERQLWSPKLSVKPSKRKKSNPKEEDLGTVSRF